jgi:hypothetical protein
VVMMAIQYEVDVLLDKDVMMSMLDLANAVHQWHDRHKVVVHQTKLIAKSLRNCQKQTGTSPSLKLNVVIFVALQPSEHVYKAIPSVMNASNSSQMGISSFFIANLENAHCVQ